MMTDLVLPIVTISGIAIAGGYLLNAVERETTGMFDERQLIERGRGANLTMTVALVYMLTVYVGLIVDLLQREYIAAYAFCGLAVVVIVYDSYCIFHDAFLHREQNWGREAKRHGSLGAIWLALCLSRQSLWGAEYALIHGVMALVQLSRSMMLLLWALILHIRSRREEQDEADG